MSDTVGVIQLAIPPYKMRCDACKAEWLPQPVTRGPTKGQITDTALEKSVTDHWKTCEGISHA